MKPRGKKTVEAATPEIGPGMPISVTLPAGAGLSSLILHDLPGDHMIKLLCLSFVREMKRLKPNDKGSISRYEIHEDGGATIIVLTDWDRPTQLAK